MACFDLFCTLHTSVVMLSRLLVHSPHEIENLETTFLVSQFPWPIYDSFMLQ